MTTIYDELCKAVMGVINDRFALYLVLNQRPDVKSRLETLCDIVTLFSIEDSILHNQNVENKKISERINEFVESYYRSLNQGSSGIIGATPAIRFKEELDDLVHTLSPMLDREMVLKYFRELPTDEFTRKNFEEVQSDYLLVVKVILITIIKSAVLLIKFPHVFGNKPKGNRNNDGAAPG